MDHNFKKILAVCLILAMLLLTGCQSVGAPAAETADMGEADVAVVEIGDDSFDPALEYAYSDKIFDRSATEGRMAVYYFRSNHTRPKPVGQSVTGDAALMIAPDGTTLLIDFNMAPATAHVVDYLNRLGITELDYVMASHTDMDHCGGYNALLRYIKVNTILISESPSYMTTDHKAGRFIALAQEKGAAIETLHAGMEMDFGGVNMKVLWPTEEFVWPASPTTVEVNDCSLVVKFTYGESSFLFGGDINSAQEMKLAEMYGEALQADILKMHHHGSKTSNCQKWLEAVQPKLTCGMAGAVSSSEVLERYMYMEIPFTLSVLDGAVVVATDGDGVYDIQVEKDRADNYYGLLPTVDGFFQIQ